MMTREQLPNRRASVLRSFEHRGRSYMLGVSCFPGTHRVAEIFLSNTKPGSESESVARDGAILASLALQNGVDLATLRHAVTRSEDGSASTAVGHALDLLAVVSGGSGMNMLPTVSKTATIRATVGSLKCAHCKLAMVPKIYPGMPKRFCSPNCRLAAHRKAKEAMRPNEFFTPAYIIEAARACMGGIDLDPASCAAANETVRATAFYDVKQDGLKQPWFGRVWLNPPFGNFSGPFIKKAVEEIEAGTVREAIILVKASRVPTRSFIVNRDLKQNVPKSGTNGSTSEAAEAPLDPRRKSLETNMRGIRKLLRSGDLDEIAEQLIGAGFSREDFRLVAYALQCVGQRGRSPNSHSKGHLLPEKKRAAKAYVKAMRYKTHCSVCGRQPIVWNTANPKRHIASMAAWGAPIPSIEAEIAKCTPYCKQCFARAVAK